MKRLQNFIKSALLSTVIFGLSAPGALKALEEDELSLAAIFNLNPLSMIVDVDSSVTYDINPSAVTVITARDIELSPARDLVDLIETYVPGAWWLAHNEGAHAGFRGIINDRNTKFLLVVNGVVLNEKFANGVTSEMENWDLSDIEKVEIIRGPGSVTFGPGAVSGVVSITTKRPIAEGATVRAGYVSGYDSRGASYSSNLIREHYKVAFNASITSTDGLDNPKAFGADRGTSSRPAEWGYWGDEDGNFESRLGNPVLNFYQDYRHRPQIKAMLDVNFLKNARAWVRYTSMGDVGLHGFAEGAFQSQLLQDGRSINEPINGPGDKVIDSIFISDASLAPYVNLRGRSIRQLSGNLSNKFVFTDKLSLNTRLYAKSTDVEIRKGHRRSISWEHALFLRYQEQEGNLRAIFNFNDPLLNLALGLEYNQTRYDTGWGREDVYLLDVIQRPATPDIIPTWWEIHMASVLGEALLNLDKISEVFKGQHLLLSGRFDLAGDNDGTLYSAPLISPRFAWIGDFGKVGTFKIIAQQSNRMGNTVELYRANKADKEADAELLRGIEGIFQKSLLENRLVISGSGYFNSIQNMGWSTSANSTVLQGTFEVYGAELDAKFTHDKYTVGGNLAITRLHDVELEWDNIDPKTSSDDKQTGIRSGITFAEYYYLAKDPGDAEILLKSQGSNLANTPNFIAKLFGNVEVLESKNLWAQGFTLHGDLHVLTDWAGEQEGLDMIKKSAKGTGLEDKVDDFLKTLDEHKIYTADVRLNASLEWRLLNNLRLNGYILNLLGSNDNKRYQYSSGHQGLISPKANWHEEPRVFGVKASYKF